MAALPFGPAQSAAIMVEGERDSVRIQSPLMQINADTVCLVRTQFQHMTRRRNFCFAFAFEKLSSPPGTQSRTAKKSCHPVATDSPTRVPRAAPSLDGSAPQLAEDSWDSVMLDAVWPPFSCVLSGAAAGNGGIFLSVFHTHAVSPGALSAFSLAARSRGSSEALTTCSGVGFAPVSRRRTFGNDAALRASYRNGFMNRRLCCVKASMRSTS